MKPGIIIVKSNSKKAQAVAETNNNFCKKASKQKKQNIQ